MMSMIKGFKQSDHQINYSFLNYVTSLSSIHEMERVIEFQMDQMLKLYVHNQENILRSISGVSYLMTKKIHRFVFRSIKYSKLDNIHLI